MLKFNTGIDIAQEIGKIRTLDDARALFDKHLDNDQLKRLEVITSPDVLIKIANAIVMCEPDKVWINTGCESRQTMHPRHGLAKRRRRITGHARTHHPLDLKEEQGRIIDRTYYIANDDELVSSLALRMNRTDALDVVRKGHGGHHAR